MKKSIKMLLLALGRSMALVACNGGQEANAPAETKTENAGETEKADETEASEVSEESEEAKTNEMAFITTDETKEIVDAGESDEYILLDVRKAEDYETDHVDGFISADLDAAKNGDTEDGVAKLKEALDGKDLENSKVLIMCYSGAGYAQVATDLLINDLNVNPENVLTVEGGMKAW